MTYISYATVKFYYENQLDEHGNPFSVEEKIWMIVSNLLIIHIYITHPMIVLIRNLWNIYMKLTLFPPDFVHLDLVLLVQY